jgi:hypothetical protein
MNKRKKEANKEGVAKKNEINQTLDFTQVNNSGDIDKQKEVKGELKDNIITYEEKEREGENHLQFEFVGVGRKEGRGKDLFEGGIVRKHHHKRKKRPHHQILHPPIITGEKGVNKQQSNIASGGCETGDGDKTSTHSPLSVVSRHMSSSISPFDNKSPSRMESVDMGQSQKDQQQQELLQQQSQQNQPKNEEIQTATQQQQQSQKSQQQNLTRTQRMQQMGRAGGRFYIPPFRQKKGGEEVQKQVFIG